MNGFTHWAVDLSKLLNWQQSLISSCLIYWKINVKIKGFRKNLLELNFTVKARKFKIFRSNNGKNKGKSLRLKSYVIYNVLLLGID